VRITVSPSTVALMFSASGSAVPISASSNGRRSGSGVGRFGHTLATACTPFTRRTARSAAHFVL
jgi:hypothetical protein